MTTTSLARHATVVNPQSAAYVTLARASAAAVYRPVVRDERGQRPAPISIKRPTLRNTLSKSMSYAAAKGMPFRLEHPELAAEAASVQAELAADYGIEVDVQAATMKVICAWCGKFLYEVDDPSGQGGTSHGVCEECSKKFLEDAKRNQPKPAAELVEVQQDGYDLALFPWEDPATVVAEAEAIREEQDARPGLGWELTDEDIDILFGRESMRVASDPILAKWEADGKPSGFTFSRDFADVRGGLEDEPGYEMSTQPYAW